MSFEARATTTPPVSITGTSVDVRSADGGSRRQRATIVRVHRNGDVSVKYDSTGETEKNVSVDRIRIVGATTGDEQPVFKMGDSVSYLTITSTSKKDQESDGKEDGAGTWREGTVKMCRPDGLVDVIDSETKEVVRKLPATSVRASRDKKLKKKKKTKDSLDSTSEKVEKQSAVESGEDDSLLEVGASVEVKGKRSGEWQPAKVQKARSDGSYDVVLDSDSGEVRKQVARKLIRPRKATDAKKKPTATKKKTKKKTESVDDDDDDNEKPAIRKRNTSARKTQRKTGSNAEDEDNDGDTGDDAPSDGRHRQRNARSRAIPARFSQLRANQAVEFDDKRGGVHRGRIKQLRSDDDTCDIAHDSDEGETVSRRVPAASIRPVPTLTRLFGGGGPLGLLQVNTRVYYRGKDGVERKAIVLKVWKDDQRGEGGEPSYDVEDLADGEMFKKVPASKLRPVPWLGVSLPQWNTNFSAGLPSFMAGPVLRRGVKVRFCRRVDGRAVWVDGIIAKVKSDDACIVEFWGDADDGKKDRVIVKNRDIQARFFQFSMPSASAAFAGLSLPSIELLPRTTIKVGTAVEVAVAGGEKIMLGTVLSFNESSQTYAIQYRDGSKSKSVARESVRVSLRRLRVGTEVEMIVEGPCKEVSTLDGEVAWVHRDEKVAVRINGGNNDVFAEVCPHALTVDGQPAFSAPLSSTWFELVGFRLNLMLEVFVYAWLAFGLIVELGDMITLARELSADRLEDAQHMSALYASEPADWSQCVLSPLVVSSSSSSLVSGSRYLVIPEEAVVTDRAWLVALTVAKAVLTVGGVLMSGRRVQSKLSALADDFIDVKEFQQDQVLRRRLGVVSGLALLASFCSLFVYASLLGKFEHYCLFTTSRVRSFDTLAVDWMSRMFEIRSTSSGSTVQLVLALASKTTMSLFRALAFFLLLFAMPSSSTDFVRRVVLLLPLAVALAALLAAVAIASLTVFYLVQRAHVVQLDSDLMLSSDANLAIVGVLVAIWMDVSVFRLASAAGRYFEAQMVRQWTLQTEMEADVLDQAERGEFGLQAKKEALITRVEQRQAQLGAFKLSVLRVHRDWLVHMSVMIVGIAVDARLRQSVTELYVGADETLEHMARTALDIHLGFCCAWLVLVVLAALLAVVLRRQGPPELLAFILAA